jgi:hypothetical protein
LKAVRNPRQGLKEEAAGMKKAKSKAKGKGKDKEPGKKVARKGRAKKGHARKSPVKKSRARKRTIQRSTIQKSTAKPSEPKDMVQVQQNFATMVGEAAEAIVTGVIEKAKSGQLASAKYLFEAVGLYPAKTEAASPEDSLAFTLLQRMGLPTDGVVKEEGVKAGSVASLVNTAASGPAEVDGDDVGSQELDASDRAEG